MEENKFKFSGKKKLLKEASILSPQGGGLKFVLSFTNTAGKTEDNPALDLFEKRWKRVRVDMKGWFANKTGAYKLGAVNQTAVQSDVWVIHLLCQDDNLKTSEEGLAECLKQVLKMAKFEKASIHVSSKLLEMSKNLDALLDEHIVKNGINVYFYDGDA